MKKKLLFLGLFLGCFLGIHNVDAAGSVKLSLSCPAAAKPNTEITCIVYGSRTGSEVESVEEMNATPMGALKRADYLVNYESIPQNNQKNIGTITIQTGNIGTGQIEFVFDGIHFVDGSFQSKVSVTKNITINKTGKSTSTNTTRSGSSTNNSQTNSNSNRTSTTSNADTYLKDIKLSRGILSPAFAKNVYSYTVKVDSDVDKISIDAIKNDAGQKIEGEVVDAVLKYGKNSFKLVVSNGTSSKRTYEVVVERQDNRDSNASLLSLSLSTGKIKFSPSIYAYETKVLYEVENIDVIATAEKDTSKVTVDGAKNLKVGENTITITVTAEKGNEQKYTIKVNRLAAGQTIGDNANIKSITISGYKFDFDYDKQEYKLVIKNEDKLIIDIVMEDPNASYQILGNSNLKDGSVITITTMSQDGTTTQTYTIEITKPKYSIYYVIAGVLISLAIATPIAFYFKYVKPKKELTDINGNKIHKEDLPNKNYRKKLLTTIPKGKSKKEPVKTQASSNQPNNVSVNTVPQPNPQNVINTVSQPNPQNVVNIGEPTVQNVENSNNATNIALNNGGINNIINQQNMVNEQVSQNEFSASKCPKCERDLLGNPDICPYCNTRLR